MIHSMKPPFLFAVALMLLQVYLPAGLYAQSDQEAVGNSRLGFGFRVLWSTFDLNTFNSFFDGNEFPELMSFLNLKTVVLALGLFWTLRTGPGHSL